MALSFPAATPPAPGQRRESEQHLPMVPEVGLGPEQVSLCRDDHRQETGTCFVTPRMLLGPQMVVVGFQWRENEAALILFSRTEWKLRVYCHG